MPLQSVNSDTANITVDKSRDASKYPEKPLTSAFRFMEEYNAVLQTHSC